MSTCHPSQGPTEMTAETDTDKNKALIVLETRKCVNSISESLHKS